MISCVLLAGGQSKRMGKDKAFLSFKNKTFLRWVLEALDKYCDEIIIVANKDQSIYLNEAKGLSANIKFTSDIHPYEGPLNGIISSLDLIENENIFVATCDTPLINSEVIKFLHQTIENYEAVIPVVKDKFQPLNALYKKSALEKAKNIYKSGQKSMFSFIKQLNKKIIYEKDLKNIDKNLYTYWSINTPEDYERLKNLC